MSKDYQKLIAEFHEKFPYHEKKGPRIGASDIKELYEISKGDTFYLIDNSLLAGIMIGYKYAKNEKHNARKKAK